MNFRNLNLLVVEGNLQKENENFKNSGIPTHAESLKESLSYYTKDLNIDVFNPCSEKSFDRIIPNIKNETELSLLIRSCYLPPYGSRGVGYARANMFGKNINRQNKKPIVIAMIENINSVKRLEKILSVKGLDAILIGPYDLSASMGITGKFNNLKFKLVIKKINKLSKKFKIPCGIHVIEPNYKALKKYVKDGYQFLPFCTDALLLNHSIKSSFKK